MKYNSLLMLAVLLACSPKAHGVKFNPCDDPTPVVRGGNMTIGVVYWPGGLESDWGDSLTGLQPCDPAAQANLTAGGAHFAVFDVRVDRLTVLKISYPEQLLLTTKAAPNTPAVVSAVAFRGKVRSDVRYIMSLAPEVTKGVGFVGSLALIAKFETGMLKYLQFYNLTCNDCGGTSSNQCLNRTSCGLAPSSCTCPATAADGTAAASSPAPSGRHLLQESNTTSDNPTTPAAGSDIPPPSSSESTPPPPTTDPAAGSSIPPAVGPTDSTASTGSSDETATNTTTQAVVPVIDPAAAPQAAVAADNGTNSSTPDASGTPSTSPEAAPADDGSTTSIPGMVVADPTAGALDAVTRGDAASPSPAPALGVADGLTSTTSQCSYANLTFCATGINLAFEGVDVNSRAFTTAASVRKLSSFSLLALYNLGKERFLDVKDLFTDTSQSYWGKFGAVQQDIVAAYSGNAEAGRTTGSVDTVG